MYIRTHERTPSHFHSPTADNMAGLLTLVAALVAAVATFSNAATLHTRESVESSAVLCTRPTGPFPNPGDCGSFWQCDASGNIVTHQCPAGLEFNAWRRVCDYPERARCSTGGWRPPPPPPPAEDNKPPAEDEQPPAEVDQPSEEEPDSPPAEAPKCPAVENPEEAVQLPNPDDCHSFYKCDASGVAWLKSCPAGLEYNARLRVCDYPENAGCSRPPPAEEPAEDESAEGDEEGGKEEENEGGDGSGAEEPADPAANVPECPAVENPEEAIQLANPSDCGSFYKCDENRVAWLIPCPAGLHYNAELRVCDYAANAGCASA